MSSPSTSQLLKEPQHERPIEQASADSREERNVVSKSTESDSASSDVSDDESDSDDDLPLLPEGTVIYTRMVKGGKAIIRNIDKPAPAVVTSKMQRQTKTIKPMIRAQDKENKGPRFLVPVPEVITSDLENDKQVRPVGRKKVVKELQFGNSPAKCSALGVKQDKGICKNPTTSHYQRSSPADQGAKPRSNNA